MRTPSQRRARGTLFVCLGLAFDGIAVAAALSDVGATGKVVIVVAAGAIGAWLLGLGVRGLRPR